MGREYRLSRDPGLREESDWRDARVSPVVWAGARSPRAWGIAGIDVGEDFLDCAWLGAKSRALHQYRIELRTLGADGRVEVIDELAQRLRQTLPIAHRGTIALIDSPRWPRDLNCAAAGIVRRAGEVRGRAIDQGLRGLVGRIGGGKSAAVPMFPTPKSAYFRGQIGAPTCKPHLRAMGIALLGAASGAEVRGGGNFTRFMIAGFATYRALEQLKGKLLRRLSGLAVSAMESGREAAVEK